tara:strand:- start:158 stop:2383 length:2226 start_codon:yes stop_codon:yes gene_type:complete
MFNYGGFKLFLLKALIGALFVFFSSFLIISIFTHSPNDPGIGNLRDSDKILNFFGYWGSLASSFFIIVFGRVSLVVIAFFFYIGILLSAGIKSKQLILKFFLIILSTISFDLMLITQALDFYETSIISRVLFDIFLYYLQPIRDNIYYNLIVSIFLLSLSLSLVFFCFSIRIRFLNIILFKLYSFLSFIFIKFRETFKRRSINTRRANKNKIKSEPTIKKTNIFQTRLGERKHDKEVNRSGNDFIYSLPETDFLIRSKTKNSYKKEVENFNKTNCDKLERVLEEYGVDGNVVGFKTGPIVTLYEFVPSAGIKASKVIGLSDDIARAMSSVSARISSQPGKTSLGIEIPNLKRENVMFGDLVERPEFEMLNNSLTLALGKDISGQVVFADLEKMPHLLIAGTTGSGKSVGINTIIMSILYRFKPDECKLILIDPKMLELSIYEDIPHLLTPVVTNPNKAVFALKWVVREMENRYKLMSSLNVKNINSYNEKSKKVLSTGKKLYRKVQTGIDNDTRQPIIEKREIPLEKMPFIVVVIDEMADLMMVAGKEVENLVQRLAQMARASGIHLVTATQRPSVDVITGTIKANFPSRLSYKVASKFDSRTILNEMGAEQLLGSGDMLFLENGANLKRLHGGFLSETEIEKVVSSIKQQATFDQSNELVLDEKKDDDSMAFKFDDGEVDALYSKAIDIVISQQKVSTSYIQRYLQIGYNRAARIVEKMEEEGIISEANNAGKRQVLRKK